MEIVLIILAVLFASAPIIWDIQLKRKKAHRKLLERNRYLQYELLSLDEYRELHGLPVYNPEPKPELTVKDVFEGMTEDQKNVVYFMIGAAMENDQKGLPLDTPITLKKPLPPGYTHY